MARTNFGHAAWINDANAATKKPREMRMAVSRCLFAPLIPAHRACETMVGGARQGEAEREERRRRSTERSALSVPLIISSVRGTMATMWQVVSR